MMHDAVFTIMESLVRVDAARIFSERGMWIDELTVSGMMAPGQLTITVVVVKGGFLRHYGKFECKFAVDWREQREGKGRLEDIVRQRATYCSIEAQKSRGEEHPCDSFVEVST